MGRGKSCEGGRGFIAGGEATDGRQGGEGL